MWKRMREKQRKRKKKTRGGKDQEAKMEEEQTNKERIKSVLKEEEVTKENREKVIFPQPRVLGVRITQKIITTYERREGEKKNLLFLLYIKEENITRQVHYQKKK